MVKILEDILTALDTDAAVTDIRQGLFYTAVMTRHCGLASTLAADAFKQEPPLVKEPGLLLKKSARELALMCLSKSIPEAAIGMAAINSLVDVDEKRCGEMNARELIADKGRGRKVAIVGHFPFVSQLKEIVRELWVIEKNPAEGDYPESSAAQFLPQADVIGITGTALTNHTIEQLLKLCSPSAYVVVLGGTVPLCPVLFDYGIDAVAGTKVTNPTLAISCVSEGANYRQIKGIRQLIMTKQAL